MSFVVIVIMHSSNFLIGQRKYGCGPRSQNIVSKNTIKNAPEDELTTFCCINIHIKSKYRWNSKELLISEKIYLFIQ